jgi:cytochrome bd ubiquinol oxidase subunit I
MEGVFAFFWESSLPGVLLFRNRFSRRALWFVALMLFVGIWLSGYFILVTNAWMLYPISYQVEPDGRPFVNRLAGLLTNPCTTDPALSLTVFNALLIRMG